MDNPISDPAPARLQDTADLAGLHPRPPPSDPVNRHGVGENYIDRAIREGEFGIRGEQERFRVARRFEESQAPSSIEENTELLLVQDTRDFTFTTEVDTKRSH
jgi:hypothetical protein